MHMTADVYVCTSSHQVCGGDERKQYLPYASNILEIWRDTNICACGDDTLFCTLDVLGLPSKNYNVRWSEPHAS